jgi:hypothetical protein
MNSTKNTFSAVTTFNLKKHPYGVEMLNSFFQNWPNEITLTAYIENSHFADDSLVKDKIIIKEFHENIPQYNNFVNSYKHKEKKTADYRFDAFRFAYKVYAIAEAIKNTQTKYLIWLDADIRTYTKLPINFLNTIVKEDCYLSFLGREHVKNVNYSECGFLIFNTEHFIHKIFWNDMMKMYDKGQLFFENEWHDSYIFDVVRKNLEKKRKIKKFDISHICLVDVKNYDHVFIASVLGKFMDHKKGNRKTDKWSGELLYRIKKEKEI